MKLYINEIDFIQKIPHKPGVYRFFALKDDGDEELLYVGKALNLQKRIKSYFQKSSTLSPRISLMVKKITHVQVTITDNEVSALILENNLIKNLKPKYNIIFRDDKTYPVIRISNDQCPRIDSYRGKIENNKRYFGPYPNVQAMRYSLDLIQRIFKLRTCTNTMFSNRSRPCMLYQINRCTGPCVNFISNDDYAKNVNSAINFLNGNYKSVLQELQSRMMEYAIHEDFEHAAMVRDEISLIQALNNKQIINNYKKPIDTDIIVVMDVNDFVYFYVIIVRGGVYVSDNHFKIKNLNDNVNDVFNVFLENYYLDKIAINTSDVPKFEIHTKFEGHVDDIILDKIYINTKFSNALNELYIMGLKNIQEIIKKSSEKTHFKEAVSILMQQLHSAKINRIECIDVSHNHGANTVASIVVFDNGDMNNKLYRRYNLATDNEGQPLKGNDILALELVLERRFAATDLDLPDILLVDGGYNQLNVAKKVLNKYGLENAVILLAVFKGEHRDPMKDSLILPNGVAIRAINNLLIFQLIHKLRDEAHRFAITGHRRRGEKKMTSSIMDEIPNIGAKKKQLLLSHFGSSKNVAVASIEDLKKVPGIGDALANDIYGFFHGKE